MTKEIKGYKSQKTVLEINGTCLKGLKMVIRVSGEKRQIQARSNSWRDNEWEFSKTYRRLQLIDLRNPANLKQGNKESHASLLQIFKNQRQREILLKHKQ